MEQQQQQSQSDPPIIPPLPGSNYQSHFNPPAVNGNNYKNLNQQQQHITMPKASTGPPKETKHQMPTLEHRSTATSRITSQTMPDLFKNQSVVDEDKSKNEIDNIRAVRLSNDIIKPILPSESEEPVDAVIERFRASRKKALIDCNDFTPSIQFEWAITLLETVSRSDVLSRMAIDGKIRKKAINYKNLKSQRQQFVNTGVKVLTRLLQVAPNATRARLYLGDIYSGGIHPGIIPKDDEKGYKLFYDAALKQEDPVAYYRVACCLEVGIGVEQNVPLSYEFFNKAAELGDPSAMCQLGMFAFAGSNNQVSNVAQSIYWHQKAADGLKDPKVMGDNPLISARSFSDSRGALYTLAKLHQTDLNILCLNKDSPRAKSTINQLISLGVFRNLNGGLYYYLEAAKLKHREAMAALGFIYATGYFPTSNFTKDKESSGNKPFTAIDSKKSIYWYSKAAAADHVYASMGLAKWYGSGANGVLKQDPEQGFLWMKKAADEGGLSDAEYMVGCCFESGFGCEKNKSRAVVYFRRASSKNHQGAISKLQKLNSN
ncbi:unnamed protein product [[Candida] boidinii]|nr:unnamed protein product [[Candida] boidinii]